MAGLRLTVVDCGPLNPEANMLVAFAPGKVAVVTTVGIIEHPKHGLVLWDTGINDAVADPDRCEAYWGPGMRDALGAHGYTREHAIDAQLRKLGSKPEDVRYVVYSHLHLDHAGGMSYFPKAVHVAQRDELRGPVQAIARKISRTFARSTSSSSTAISTCSRTAPCDSSVLRAIRPAIRH